MSIKVHYNQKSFTGLGVRCCYNKKNLGCVFLFFTLFYANEMFLALTVELFDFVVAQFYSWLPLIHELTSPTELMN